MDSSLLYTDVAARLLLRPLVRFGYWQFERSGKTPKPSYASFRKLHCVTRGEINRELAARAQKPAPVFELGEGDAIPAHVIPDAVATLDRDGYCILPHRLDAALCADLVGFARAAPAQLVPGGTVAKFDINAPRAPRYLFPESALLESSAARRLLADPSFMALAAQYLRTSPINDLVTMWWSAPFGAASSEAAQLFHFDMDRIRFLKIFVYLTDVTAETGPHVYVRGSHLAKPARLYRDRRFTDAEIAAAFPADDIREITGPTGTIIVADTSGIHKGKPLQHGARLVFQLELTSSLFGQTYERHRPKRDDPDPLAVAIRRYPTVLRRFT